jgi:hypothetical protein
MLSQLAAYLRRVWYDEAFHPPGHPCAYTGFLQTLRWREACGWRLGSSVRGSGRRAPDAAPRPKEEWLTDRDLTVPPI